MQSVPEGPRPVVDPGRRRSRPRRWLRGAPRLRLEVCPAVDSWLPRAPRLCCAGPDGYFRVARRARLPRSARKRPMNRTQRARLAGHGTALLLLVWPALAFAEEAERLGFFDRMLQAVNHAVANVLFFNVTGDALKVGKVSAANEPVLDPTTGLQQMTVVETPFIVLFLLLGAIFFTFWYRFINVRGLRHAVNVVRGQYDNPEDVGEITHFQALTSALSATVGLGNIAGVAVAIQLGGPGAVFWMVVTAVFGMTAKFSSCALAQLYRQENKDGSVSGGPMYYLDLGIRSFGGPTFRLLGKTLGVIYAVMVMGGSFGGGNMFQSNQSFAAVSGAFGLPEGSQYAFGVILAVLVALVIIGGIGRIGAATSRIVPLMVLLYCGASAFILLTHAAELPGALRLMATSAFSDNALWGGAVGVAIMGVRRAAFSNEAGVGSASIAHAAAKTDEPVREGLVAMLGPVIDTIVVCTMTASVVIVTGAWNDPALAGAQGVQLTNAAFGKSIPWFPYVLSICILLFAYSTMISWSYYGEKGWVYLLDHFGGRGQRSVIVYRLLFVFFVFVGAVTQLDQVLEFSDLMILAMALPNIVGGVVLAPRVLPHVRDYWHRYNNGSMPRRV